MGKLPPELQPPNPNAKKYTSIAAFIKDNWRFRRPNMPFFDYELSAYAIVVTSDRFISEPIFAPTGDIIQSNFAEQISFAQRRMLAYYNKIIDELNKEILDPVTVLREIEIRTEPNTSNLYYVTIDAATFDAIPDQGSYILTPMTKRTSINLLAEEYRDYFRVTDDTSAGQRARIAEILRTNGINLLTEGKSDVEEWIYRVNYGVTIPPGKDTRFNEGSEIYLPRTEPDFTKVTLGGREIELTIGEIDDNIDKLISMLRKYRVQISSSTRVVRGLNFDKQVELLREFYPKLVSHFRSNDYRINDFFADKVRIGVDADFNLIYIGIGVGGTTAYMNKAIPGLAVEPPFDDPRTMNFLAKLSEIVLLNSDTFAWDDFIRTYVFPEPIIETRKPIDLLPDLQQGSKTILEQLADRFNKFPDKSDRMLAEENSILATPKIMAAIAAEQANTARNAGDAVMQNLTQINARIADGPATAIFNELLNKIDYKSLAASALECLMEQVPFDCEDIIVAVAEVSIMAPNSLFPNASGIEGINQAFKSRMRSDNHPLAEEALSIAQSRDFTRYEIKYGYPFYLTLEEEFADKKVGEIYLAALEKSLTNNGVDYDSIFQEVCGLFSNPFQLLPNAFSIPTIFFPDDLPTVNIDAGYIASLESFFLDAISSMIIQMVQGLLNQLLNNCIENAELLDGDSENGNTPNASALADAIANTVGDENFDDTIADLLEDLGESVSQATGSLEFLGQFVAGQEITSELVDADPPPDRSFDTAVSAMKEFFDALKEEMQDDLRLISLIDGSAPDNFAQDALNIIHRNGGMFTYGFDSEKNLKDVIGNLPDVREMFEKIATYVDIRPIVTQLNVLAGKAGCVDLNDYISKRTPLWCGSVAPENIPGVAQNLLSSSVDIMGDLWKVILDTPPTGSAICTDLEQVGRGSVAKDPLSYGHMLEQVVRNFFDPVYMAYDSSVLLLPEPYYVQTSRKKTVNRTIKADAGVTIDFYNFSKLQEEKINISFDSDSEDLVGLKKLAATLGLDFPGEPSLTIMNPEFKRLLATGYIPSTGVVDGVYGPYTSAISKTEVDSVFGGLIPPGLSLPAVDILDNISMFALNSSNAFETIDESMNFIHGTIGGAPVLSVALREPVNLADKSLISQAVLKIDLHANNEWQVSIGTILPSLNSNRSSFLPGNIIGGENGLFETTSNPDDLSDASYDLEYRGENTFPATAQEVLDYIETRTSPTTPAQIPQVDLLTRFMKNILQNGIREDGLSTDQSNNTRIFTKEIMLRDAIKQLSSGAARQCLNSPMFRFTDTNNAPYMSLVDWAPIPDEEEAECGYDPHILSIETMMRRVIEDYNNEIECSPLSREISTDAKGRNELSSLEAASMAGLVMTTLRAYALEQLMRAVFPVSAFPCKSFLTPIQISFIVDKVIENLSEKSLSYFEAFLLELEKVFANRMGEFSAFGTIPDVIAAGEELGIEWVYADCAKMEYEANTLHEPQHVTLPSGEIVPVSDITAQAIHEQLSNLPTPNAPPPGAGGISDLFGQEDTPTTLPPGIGIQPPALNFEAIDPKSFQTINDDPAPWVPPTDGPTPPEPEECESLATTVIPKTPLVELLKCRLGFLVEEQLYSVTEKLQDLVSESGQFSFDERFLSKNMPLLNVAKNERSMDDSRFFGSNSKDMVSAAQQEVDANYNTYFNKYSEWHTANGNWITAINLGIAVIAVSNFSLPGALAAAIFFAPLMTGLISGVLPIPVPRYLFDEETDVFYVGKHNTIGNVNSERIYKYTNVDINTVVADAFSDFLFAISEIIDNQRATVEDLDLGNLNSFLESVLEGPRLSAVIPDFTEGVFGEDGVEWTAAQMIAYYQQRWEYTPEEATSQLIKGGLLSKTAAKISYDDALELYKSDNSNPFPGDEGPSTNHSYTVSKPHAIHLAITLLNDNDLGPVTPPVVFITTEEKFFGHFTSGDSASHLVPFPWLEDFIDASIDAESLIPREGLEELLLLSSADGGQGQIIMEKYVKTKGRLPGEVASFSTADDFEGERFGQDSVPAITPKINLDGEIPSVVQVLSPRETINTSDRKCFSESLSDNSNQPTPPLRDAVISIGGQINTNDEQIWNIDDFENYLKNLATTDELYSYSFSKVSYGIRLVYVAPPPPLVEIGGSPRSAANDAGHRKLYDAGIDFDFNDEVISRSKSYLEYESYNIHGAFDTIGDANHQGVGIDETGTGAAPLPIIDAPGEGSEPNQERFLHLFPLMSVETPIADGIKRKDILGILNLGTRSLQSDLGGKYFSFLKNTLGDSSIYKYLFKYCVPGDTILSFVSIYANLISELPEEFFDKTKFELKNLFEILMNGGDYTFETSEEKKRGGNRGAFAHAMANYGTEGKTRNPGLFELAVKTPKEIFKGLAEFIDPIIRPASTIVKAGNAGKLLPQTMKILNPDMTPGGVLEDNYLVSNIILPPGYVPFPIGDLGGAYPIVIRNIPSTMYIDTAEGHQIAEKNEIVTFRLRDKITKGSEIGNHLFDAYLQNVFFEKYNPTKTAPGAQSLYDYYNGNPEPVAGADLLVSFPGSTERTRLYQEFALGLLNRDLFKMSRALFAAYNLDLNTVRLGIIEELKGAHPLVAGFLPDFSPATFERLRKEGETTPNLCTAREKIIAILSGQKPVDQSNFDNLATGFPQIVNPDTGKLESVLGGGSTIDWIIWGSVNGSFTIPDPPQPEVIFPGYPLPLPVTPIAMTFLPRDMVPYGPGPPHTPFGYVYHALAASEGLQNISLEQKAVQRQQEGIENKKKIYEKLCIDMERIANEEKKRRGLE